MTNHKRNDTGGSWMNDDSLSAMRALLDEARADLRTSELVEELYQHTISFAKSDDVRRIVIFRLACQLRTVASEVSDQTAKSCAAITPAIKNEIAQLDSKAFRKDPTQ